MTVPFLHNSVVFLLFGCLSIQASPVGPQLTDSSRMSILRGALGSAAIMECFINGIPTTGPPVTISTSTSTSTTTPSSTSSTQCTTRKRRPHKPWGGWRGNPDGWFGTGPSNEIFQQCADNAIQVITIQNRLSPAEQEIARHFLKQEYEKLHSRKMSVNDMIQAYKQSINVNF